MPQIWARLIQKIYEVDILTCLDTVNSKNWVCRTRQNVTFRDPKTHPIRNRLLILTLNTRIPHTRTPTKIQVVNIYE